MDTDVLLCPVPAGSSPYDVFLYDPAAGCAVTTSLPRDDKPPGNPTHVKPPPGKKPPVGPIRAVSLFNDLIGRYGIVEGNRIYRAMEAERKGPFQPGKKYGPRLKKKRRS